MNPFIGTKKWASSDSGSAFAGTKKWGSTAASVPAGPFVQKGVTFGGANWVEHEAASDMGRICMSFWVKPITNDNGVFWDAFYSTMVCGQGFGAQIRFHLGGDDSYIEGGFPITFNAWTHYLVRGDVGTNKLTRINQFYKNNVSMVPNDIFSWGPGGAFQTFAGMCFGSNRGAHANKFGGAMAAIWMDDALLDFDNPAVRAKFINPTTLLPVSLGVSGELPTGVAPKIFHDGDDASFGTNKGTGGVSAAGGTGFVATTVS